MNRRDFTLAAAAALSLGGAARAASFPKIDGPRRNALRPPATHLIALFHGTGGDGPDMFGLAPDLGRFAPTAAVAAPNAATPLGSGYSWIAAGPGSGVTPLENGIVQQFLDSELARYGLGPERLIMVGFSQGAFVVLNMGLRRRTPPAAIVAFAGAPIRIEGLTPGAPRPPVLLIQGAQDPGAARGTQAAAIKTLKALGAPVQAHTLPDLGHSIDARGVKLAGEFIQGVIGARR